MVRVTAILVLACACTVYAEIYRSYLPKPIRDRRSIDVTMFSKDNSNDEINDKVLHIPHKSWVNMTDQQTSYHQKTEPNAEILDSDNSDEDNTKTNPSYPGSNAKTRYPNDCLDWPTSPIKRPRYPKYPSQPNMPQYPSISPQYPDTDYPIPQYPDTQYPTPQYPNTKSPKHPNMPQYPIISPQYSDTQYPDTQYPIPQYPNTKSPKHPNMPQYPIISPQYSDTQYPDTQYLIPQYPNTKSPKHPNMPQYPIISPQYPDTQYPDTQYPTPQYPNTKSPKHPNMPQYPIISPQYPDTQYPDTQYPIPQYPNTKSPKHPNMPQYPIISPQYPDTQYPDTQYPDTQYPIPQYPNTKSPKHPNMPHYPIISPEYPDTQYLTPLYPIPQYPNTKSPKLPNIPQYPDLQETQDLDMNEPVKVYNPILVNPNLKYNNDPSTDFLNGRPLKYFASLFYFNKVMEEIRSHIQDSSNPNIDQSRFLQIISVIEGMMKTMTHGKWDYYEQDFNARVPGFIEYANEAPSKVKAQINCIFKESNQGISKLKMLMSACRHLSNCDNEIQALIKSGPHKLQKEAQLLLALGEVSKLYWETYSRMINSVASPDTLSTSVYAFVMSSKEYLRPLIRLGSEVRRLLPSVLRCYT